MITRPKNRQANSAPVTTLAEATPVTAYTGELDIWASTIRDAGTLATAAAQLHLYRGGPIIESALTDQSSKTPGTFPVVVTTVYGDQTLVLSSTLLVTE